LAFTTLSSFILGAIFKGIHEKIKKTGRNATKYLMAD
jgi:hypothetical protein